MDTIHALDDTGYKRNIILLFLFVFVPVHYVSMSIFLCTATNKKNWNCYIQSLNYPYSKNGSLMSEIILLFENTIIKNIYIYLTLKKIACVTKLHNSIF